jgi:peroxiredoxin/outer membrane lipoprotein-sorting protein
MKKMFFVLISALIIMNLTACGNDDKSSEPKDLFINANKSSLKVQDATFKVNFSFKSKQDDFKTSVDISIKRDSKAKTGFKVLFKTEDGYGVYDGEKYYYRDDKNKKVFVSGDKIQPDMFITNNWIINPITMVMLDKDYTEEIKLRSDSLRFVGQEEFAGYKAKVVESIIHNPENKLVTITKTFFDSESNLPVKEIKNHSQANNSAVQTIEIVDLKINTNLEDAVFVMKTPDGYVTEVITPQSEPESDIVNSDAPDFTLKDINGQEITLSKLKGNVVVLDFWGTWCHWCVKAMPKLQVVHEHFNGKNVIVLGISCNERANADPKKFMAENKVTYNSLVFGDEVAQKYGVQGFPTLYVIGKDGKILNTKSGFSETMDKDLIELIEKNL